MFREEFFYFKTELLAQVIEEVLEPYEYVVYNSGLLDDNSKNPVDLKSVILNANIRGDWNLNEKIIILFGNDDLSVRKIEQRDGGDKYSIGLLENPSGVLLSIGGEFDAKFIISGKIVCRKDNDLGKEIIKLFNKAAKKCAKKKKGWYVSNDLSADYRLTTNYKSPKEYDLTW